MHIRTAVIAIFSFSALALSPDLGEAQVSDPSIAAQAPIPGSDHHYIGIGAETVNPADGALSFDLPLVPPAGRELSMTFGVRYFATDQFHLINTNGSLRWYPNLVTPYEVAGWSYQLPTYTGQVYDHFAGTTPPNNNPFYCYLTENYLFTGLDGVRRNLALGSQWLDATNTQGTCNTFPINGTLNSNLHGWTVTSPTYTAPGYPALTVTDPSGTTYQFPGGFYISVAGVGNSDGPPAAWGLLAQTITDRNGNRISLKNNELPNGGISYAANSYVDTLGRQVVAWSGLGNNGDTLTISGLSSSIILKWGTATVDFPEHGHVASGTSDCQLSPNSTAPATIKFLTEIDLPNGRKYAFAPDSTNYGRVGKITFPGGGYVRYVWGLNPSSAIVNLVCSTSVSGPAHENWIFDVPAITDRYVSYDGSTEVLHQHFSYSPTTFSTNAWTTKATTVTSTDSISGQSTITKYSYIPTGVDLGVNDFSIWSSPEVPVEQMVQYQDGSGNTLRTVNKTWKNALVENGEQIVLDNGQGTMKLYCHDSNEQVTNVYEYGYQSEGAYPGNPSCVSSSGLNTSALGPLDRHTTTAYSSFTTHIVNAPSSVTVSDGAGNTAEQTLYFYDQSSLQASGATNLTNPGSQRANATKTQRLIGAASYATSTYTYFDTGQVASSSDPCGNTTCSDMSGASHTTTYSYNDAYTILSGGQNVTYTPSGGNTNAMLTKIIDPLGHTQLFGYDYNNSQVTSFRDQNDINAGRAGETYVYNDPLARPTQTSYPDTGQTLMAYTDAVPPTVTTKRLISAGTYVVNVATTDGLGHIVQTKLTQDPDCATGDLVSTTYDGMGRVHTQSNPYCTTSDPIYGLTTYTYDAIGRTTKVAHPDGTSATSSYTGRATDVVDEGNGTRSVERISQVDGLGRLGSMCEVTSSTELGGGGTPSACGQDINKTGFVTAYTYNALDNLLSVKQGSLLNRTFSYDSLSRLLCAANPEMGGSATCPNPDSGTYTAGTTRYSYDVNGNVTTRLRPAPNQSSTSTTVTTSYQYDTLNRLTQKSYSDGVTLPAQFGYDQSTITMGSQQFTIANAVGRLSSTCVLHSSSPQCPSMTGNSYDPTGRIAQVWQSDQVTNNNISVAYQYDLIGDETNRNLSGNQYALAYNSVGRLTAFTAQNFTDATNPANILASGHYDAFGHLVSATLANGLSESWAYDNRVRPHAFALGTNCSAGTCTGSTVYSYSVLNPSTGETGYAPNGDILFANDNVNGNWAYTYDDLNRLASSNKNSGQQTYTYDYDRYGNRWHQNAPNGGFSSLLSFSGNNNRIDGHSYDAVGNLLNDGFHNYQYDPENRIISVDGSTTYTYDANGRRVFKSVGSTQTEIIYDRQGNVILYNTTAAPNSPFIQIYAGGMHIGSYVVNSTVTDTIFYYNHADWLGSERARTNLSGVACETIASLSFGDGQTTAGSCGDISPMHFTGQERDAESGLDYFGARYDGSSMGRFMTPDSLAYSELGDPQSLNLYGYVGNNPVAFIDPDGHCWKFFSSVCNTYQRFANWVDGDGFRTDRQLDKTSPSNDPRSQHRRQQEAASSSSTQGSWFTATGMAFVRWGRLGGPAHRAAVQALSQHWRAQGYQVTNEQFIRTRGGAKLYRFADVYGTKTNPDGTKSVRIGQIGRTMADGKTPVPREQSGLSDIQGAEPDASVEFYDYEAPFPSETGIPGWPVQAAPIAGVGADGGSSEEPIEPIDPE